MTAMSEGERDLEVYLDNDIPDWRNRLGGLVVDDLMARAANAPADDVFFIAQTAVRFVTEFDEVDPDVLGNITEETRLAVLGALLDPAEKFRITTEDVHRLALLWKIGESNPTPLYTPCWAVLEALNIAARESVSPDEFYDGYVAVYDTRSFKDAPILWDTFLKEQWMSPLKDNLS